MHHVKYTLYATGIRINPIDICAVELMYVYSSSTILCYITVTAALLCRSGISFQLLAR